MNKTILIRGPQCSGKTILINELIGINRSKWMDCTFAKLNATALRVIELMQINMSEKRIIIETQDTDSIIPEEVKQTMLIFNLI